MSTHPLYFFHESDPSTGFCSQWYPSPFEHEGVTYYTAEHWMMASKARLFGDEATLKEILLTRDPRKHKALGRQVQNWNQAIWEQKSTPLVLQGNIYKFTLSSESALLRRQLLDTGERELVEASPFDRVWGIGFGKESAKRNRGRWGENRLGKVLMEVRRVLRERDGDGDGKEEGEEGADEKGDVGEAGGKGGVSTEVTDEDENEDGQMDRWTDE